MAPDTADETPVPGGASGQFARLLRLIRPYWADLRNGILLGWVSSILALVPPYLSKLLIDRVYPSQDVGLMWLLAGGILTFSLSHALLSGLRTYYAAFTTNHFGTAVSLLFFDHLQRVPARFFDDRPVGDIMSRFHQVRAVFTDISAIIETLFITGVYLVLVPPMLLLLDLRLGLVALAIIPPMAMVSMYSARHLRRRWEVSAEAHAELNAFRSEVFTNVRSLKALAVEGHFCEVARRKGELALKADLDGHMYAMAVRTFQGVIVALGTGAVVWYGWHRILRGDLTLGTFIATSTYVAFLFNPIAQITTLGATFQEVGVGLARMFELLDVPPEELPEEAARASAGEARALHYADIHLRGVSFGYSPDRPVLSGVDLRIPAGATTVVLGESGSGKSTLLKLLIRMETPSAGRILVDGTPIDHIPLPELRRSVATVWQDVGVLGGTIWDNLTLGNPDADRATVDDVVRLCRLEPLIRTLEKGYATVLSEAGATLSGGQRQRIALARSLLRDAPVLLLDEATSNLDPETEREILEGIFRMKKGTTIVLVTHRVANVQFADQVCLLERGSVAAVGTHEQLLLECAAYQRHLAAGSDDDGPRPSRRRAG
jgi:ABC-type bacteriocin/lantibiotic exporter with double-glycine peptidase domain